MLSECVIVVVLVSGSMCPFNLFLNIVKDGASLIWGGTDFQITGPK